MAAFRELRGIAAAAADVLNVYMDARITDMLMCSTVCEGLEKALNSADQRGNANRNLEMCLKLSGAYDAIVLLDKKGVCVASAPESLVGRHFSGDAAFKGADTGKLTVTDPHNAEFMVPLVLESKSKSKSKGWTTAIGVPMKEGNEVEGVLIGYLRWSQIEALINSIRVGKTGYVYVLNRRNQVIVHPARQLYGVGLQDRPIALVGLDAAIKRKAASYSYEFVNVRTRKTDIKFVGFAYPREYGNFPGLGWTVGAGVDESEIVARHPLWRMLSRWISAVSGQH